MSGFSSGASPSFSFGSSPSFSFGSAPTWSSSSASFATSFCLGSSRSLFCSSASTAPDSTASSLFGSGSPLLFSTSSSATTPFGRAPSSKPSASTTSLGGFSSNSSTTLFGRTASATTPFGGTPSNSSTTPFGRTASPTTPFGGASSSTTPSSAFAKPSAPASTIAATTSSSSSGFSFGIRTSSVSQPSFAITNAASASSASAISSTLGSFSFITSSAPLFSTVTTNTASTPLSSVPAFGATAAASAGSSSAAATPAASSATAPAFEKMVQDSSSGKAKDLENTIAESKQQTTQEDNNLSLLTVTPFPDTVGVKAKENSDAPSNSALPLILISRVLKGIPQSPHFFHLRRFSELVRETLEAAWDQAFEDTVEQVRELKAKDFWDKASELWKTMEDLQGMGYNVVPIRRRLVEMAEVMAELKQSKWEILRLKIEAENHRLERSRLESIVRSLQLRAEREGMNRVRLLGEVDQMEKELPKFDALIANLAMKPFDVDV